MCQHCNKSHAEQFYSEYALDCVGCCARLVVSARPMGRAQQEAMLAVIERGKGRPKRNEVLNYVREHYPLKE